MTTQPLTLEDHEAFARVTANAFQASVEYDGHAAYYISVREHLEEIKCDGEDDIRECEAAGHVWHYQWYANSVGFEAWVAGSYAALVRKVLTESTPRMAKTYAQRCEECK